MPSESLNLYSYGASVANLTMRPYFDSACTCGQIVGQPENHLRKTGVRHWAHVFCGYVIALIVTIDQINYDRRRSLALRQLKIRYKNNDPRIPI
jgi:hypothetical protein